MGRCRLYLMVAVLLCGAALETAWNKVQLPAPHTATLVKLQATDAMAPIQAKYWRLSLVSAPLQPALPWYRQSWLLIMLGAFSTASLFMPLVIRERLWLDEKTRLEKALKERDHRLKRAKVLIRRQAVRLRKINRMKSRFFTNITHDFRTPLSLIIGPVEQVINEQPPPRVFRRRMQGVLKNARHILNLINQLLDLSKIENDQMPLELVRGDLKAHTRELVKRFRYLADQKAQRLTFISSLEKSSITFDRDKWDKILYNLIANAIRHTPRGGAIQINLFEKEREAKKWLCLEVADSGIGIDQSELASIFKRFYQAQASNKNSQGAGIGLALVKELVSLQGGSIEVHSELNKGSSFVIELPPLKANDMSSELPYPSETELSEWLPLPAIEPPPVNEKPATPLLDVLIIEDNEDMREYLRQCLQNSGYHIYEAANGNEGWQMAQSHIPDLIISDVMMPGKNGIELTRAIRGNISTSHIPVIMLTARSSLQQRLNGLFAGADAYLSKPFSPQELALRVGKLLEIRQGLHRYYRELPMEGKPLRPKNEDEFISRLREYILENISEPALNGDRIGSHFALSRVHLYRKLKSLTGQSISEFVKATRLQKAYELIIDGEFNVTEVAYQCGFSSDSHFSRSFKKRFGKSPSKILHASKYS